MTIWIKPSLTGSSDDVGDTPNDALPLRIAAALQAGSLRCRHGTLTFLAAAEPGALALVLPDTAPDRLPEVMISLGDTILPPEDERRPPLWLDRRPPDADATEALWSLALALHDRRIGPDLLGWENARPWISGSTFREAGLVLPDGRWIILRDDTACDPPRLIGPQAEVVTLAASDRAGLLDALMAWQPGTTAGVGPAPAEHRVRLAFVHCHGDDVERTRTLARKLIETAKARVTHPAGLYFNPDARREPVGFLYPGQGAQYRGMLRASLVAHPGLRDWVDALDRNYPADLSPLPSRLLLEDWPDDSPAAKAFYGLAGGGFATLTTALAHTDLLAGMGLRPDAMLGHSNGENAAMLAAGVIRTTTRRGKFSVLSHMCALFSNADESFVGKGTSGRLSEAQACFALSMPASMDPSTLDGFFDDDVLMMMDNCPSQKVVWGPAAVLERRLEALRKDGLMAIRLPLTAPYHTRHFRPIVDRFIDHYTMLDLGCGQVRLYSGFTGEIFPETREEIIETATRQWSEPVLFRKALERMYDDGIRVFIDVGPGGRLAGFVRDTLGEKPHSALALDTESRTDGTTLMRALAQMFTLGLLDDATIGVPTRATGTVTSTDAVRCPPKVHPTPAAVLPQPTEAMAPVVVVSPTVAAGGISARAAIATAHFDLMRGHLSQETRVFSALAARLKVPSGAALSGSAPTAKRPRKVLAPAQPLPNPLRQFGLTKMDISDTTLSATLCMDPSRQSFLSDHAFCKARSADPARHGLPVLPLMMSAEIAAAGAAQLAGAGWVVTGIETLRGHRWIAADSGQINLSLVVQSLPGPDVATRRFSVTLEHPNGQDDSGGGLAVTCDVVLQRFYPAPPTPLPDRMPPPPVTHVDGSPIPTGEEFADRLFHGPSFTSIRAVSGWSEAGMVMSAIAPPEDHFVTAELRGPRVLPGPLLDSAGQILALHHKHVTTRNFGLFPVIVQSMSFHGPKPEAGTALRVVTQQSATDGTLTGNLDYRTSDGQVLIRIEDLKMVFIHWPRRFEASFFHGQQDESLVELHGAPDGIAVRMIQGFDRGFLTTSNRIWLRSLAIACLSDQEREAFHALPPRGPRQEEWLMGRIVVKEAGLSVLMGASNADLAELTVAQDAAGRPSLIQPDGTRVPCSISHCAGAAVGAVAPPGVSVGIDIEPVNGPDDPFVGGALAFHPSEAPTIDRFGPKTIWCAKEAAAKALGTGLMGAPTRFRARLSGENLQIIVASEAISITLLRAKSHHVALCQIPEADAVRLARRLTHPDQTSDEKDFAYVEHYDDHK